LNTRSFGPVVLGVVIVAIVAAGIAWYLTVNVEKELRRAVLQDLQDGGFEGVEFVVDGRDITFVGEVDARIDRQRMLDIARAVKGVDDVYDQREVTNFVIGRHFELNSYAGITTVEGELPDQADVARVLEAIRSHYGIDPLGADLKVRRAVRRPPWLDDLERVLQAVDPVSPLQIEFRDETLIVTGEVADEDIRDSVKGRLENILDDEHALEVHLRLPAQIEEPTLRIEFRNGLVSVSGTVPEDDFAEQLIAALSLAFVVDDVQNNLVRDPNVRHSSWLQGLLRVIFPLAMTNWVDLQISAEEVVVRGSVRSDDELQILDEFLKENFDYTARVVNMIRKQAAAP
jgi:hypothetical protein